MTTAVAKGARRDLQRSGLALTQMFDNAVNGSHRQRRDAELSWPAIAATERLAYRTVAECWRLERVDSSPSPENVGRAAHLADLQAELRTLADAVRAGREPPAPTLTAGVLSDELTASGARCDDTRFPCHRRPTRMPRDTFGTHYEAHGRGDPWRSHLRSTPLATCSTTIRAESWCGSCVRRPTTSKRTVGPRARKHGFSGGRSGGGNAAILEP